MKRGPGNPNWQKGQSGNPGGRPKGYAEFMAACRQHTEAAVAVLVGCLASPNERIQIEAAQALLDRGWGRPAQAVTGEGGEGEAQIVVKVVRFSDRAEVPQTPGAAGEP